MNGISFVIPGEPVAKQRPRVVTRGGFARAYTPKETVNYESLVRLTAQQAGCPHYDGPVSLFIVACFEWPKSSWRKQKPRGEAWKCNGKDADNIGKSISDGLNGVAWNDDTQVAELTVRKIYVAQGEPARAEVRIEPLAERATA